MRKLAVVGWMLGLHLALAAPAAAEGTMLAQAETARSFDIPAQSLAAALLQFREQSGLQIAYRTADVAGLTTGGVSGSLAPREALRRLLAGTGLIHDVTAEGTVTIARIESGAGPQQLGPITVLGSRRVDVPIGNVPSAITVVDGQSIAREQATTSRIEDIVSRQVPGFNPTNNGVRQIRGRTAQVFVNGVPVNEQLRASSGSDLNLVAPDQLAGIEVARGANSAYGFGSPGGIIALQTPRAESAELSLRSVLRVSANPHHPGGSLQTSLYQSAAQIVGRFDYHVGGRIAYDGADYDPDGDLALGFDNAALLTNGKEALFNVDGSFGLDFGEAGRLRFTGTAGHVDFHERYALNPGVYRGPYGFLTEEPNGDDSFRTSYTAHLGYENDDVAGSQVKLELFTSHVRTEVYTGGGGLFRDEQTNEYFGFRSAVTTPLPMLTDGTAATYGVDVQRNRYFRPFFNDATDGLITLFAPDVTLDSYAPYAQLDVPVGNVVLTGGLRREEYSGHVEDASDVGFIAGGDIDSFGLTLFNAGIVYLPTDHIELYATFSQGAEITQLGRAARAAASADQIDPQPAKSDQYEIGLRGGWTDVDLALAGFYTESDLLSALVCDGINPCTPLREVRQFWGVEASADWRIDAMWGVGGIAAWMDGIREAMPGDMRRIGSDETPPLLLTGYVDYAPYPWWRNRVQVSHRASRDPFGGSAAFAEGSVDAVTLVNVSAAFDVGPGTLQVGIQNLFNTEYRSIPAESGNNGFTWLPEQGARAFASYAIRW
jgi:iron complex outermembrane receptor protein